MNTDPPLLEWDGPFIIPPMICEIYPKDQREAFEKEYEEYKARLYVKAFGLSKAEK